MNKIALGEVWGVVALNECNNFSPGKETTAQLRAELKLEANESYPYHP